MAERAVKEMGIYGAASGWPPTLQLGVRPETPQSGIHKHTCAHRPAVFAKAGQKEIFFKKVYFYKAKCVRWFMFEGFKASSSDPCAAREKVCCDARTLGC